jgi:acetyltransferase-like isoleucine patch superfamily enzyme
MHDPSRPLADGLWVLRSGVRHTRRLRARWLLRGRCEIAGNVVIGTGALWLNPGRVRIDRDVFIGREFFTESDLSIGPDVLISSRVAFIGNDHDLDSSDLAITKLPRNPAAHVTLAGDNLVGHGTIVVGSVVIGRGTVVGAGSLVTRDLPPNTICVGRPAVPIRLRRP